MIHLWNILLRNAVQGIRRNNNVFAGVVMLLSLSALLLAGNSGKVVARANDAAKDMSQIAQQNAADVAPVLNFTKSQKIVAGSPAQRSQNATPTGRSNLRDDQSTQSTGDTKEKSGNAEEQAGVDSLTLAPMSAICRQSQQVFVVPSAQLTLGNPSRTDTEVRWFWETRIDSGASPAEAPIADDQTSQSVSADSAQILLNNGDEPLVIAPPSDDYSYSFRLHIVAPMNLASDWLAVPAADNSACQ